MPFVWVKYGRGGRRMFTMAVQSHALLDYVGATALAEAEAGAQRERERLQRQASEMLAERVAVEDRAVQAFLADHRSEVSDGDHPPVDQESSLDSAPSEAALAAADEQAEDASSSPEKVLEQALQGNPEAAERLQELAAKLDAVNDDLEALQAGLDRMRAGLADRSKIDLLDAGNSQPQQLLAQPTRYASETLQARGEYVLAAVSEDGPPEPMQFALPNDEEQVAVPSSSKGKRR